ncbi:MAG: putative C-S lyase [Nitrosomonas sp.]|nr:putative C-S lyase [Nitrosomonas sp.]
MSINFDEIIPRIGTNCTKFDKRLAVFGNSHVIPLWVADMDFAVPCEVTEALISRATHPIYGYTFAPDSLYEALINWVKQRYDWSIKQEWIILCPGVVPSLTAAILALSQTHESTIILPPVYFPFFSAVTKSNRPLSLCPLHYRNHRYEIDFDRLEALENNSRILLFCSPHNPVGRVWSRFDLEQLIKIAQKKNWIIISDEIHADLTYPDYQHIPLAHLTDETANIITAIAPSKTFNIPGLNLSALIVSDVKFREAILNFFDQLHINPVNPFNIVAFETAYQKGAGWLDELTSYLSCTRDQVDDYLTKYLPDIQLVKPEGTYLLWLDCRRMSMTDSELKRFFVHQAGVGLSPGILFGDEGSGFMRMNIGTPRSNILAALEKIKKAYV